MNPYIGASKNLLYFSLFPSRIVIFSIIRFSHHGGQVTLFRHRFKTVIIHMTYFSFFLFYRYYVKKMNGYPLILVNFSKTSKKNPL